MNREKEMKSKMRLSRLEKEFSSIYNHAKEQKPAFDIIIRNIAKLTHSKAIIVPIKSKGRTIQKAVSDYKGDLSKVKDILRASIVSRVYGRVHQILNEIKSNFKIIRVKDRFQNPKSSYRDILINVLFNNIQAEVQIHVEELLNTKDYISHLLYEIERNILAQAIKENRKIFSWEEYIKDKVGEINKYSLERAWWRQKALEEGKDPDKLIFMITHNKRKFEESKSFLPTLRRIDKDLKELQSSNPKEVVREKMKEALKVIDGHIVVETVALCCEGLKGLPGPFDLFKIKKFDVKDLANMVIKSGNTRAKAISCICFANSPSEMYFFEGSCDGTIVQPRGETEFDWDKIFQPKGFKKTYAEMTIKEKNQISMRKIAFDKLLNFLHKKYSFAI